MAWSRDTPWTQGALLSGPSLQKLHPAASEHQVALAISHSCDIANDPAKEPNVEFVLGRLIEKRDGNLTRAKNPRVLHLTVTFAGEPVVIEMSAIDKFSILKDHLNSYLPDVALNLEPGELTILQAWLAARYKRQALPGALQDRLRDIVKVLEQNGQRNTDGVLGYWLDYQPREELAAAEPYELWVYVVYLTDQQEFEESAKGVAAAISGVAQKATGIDLRQCEAYSDEEFTAKDVRTKVEYRLEHLSFGTDPAGPTL